MRRHALVGTALMVTALFVSGCAGSSNPRVKGKVMLGGMALPGAKVTFDGPGGGTTVTNDAGEFEFTGATAYDTVKPGEYNVMISKQVDKKGKVVDKEELEQLIAAGLAKELVPLRYSSNDTELRAKVVEGQNNLPTFDLKSK